MDGVLKRTVQFLQQRNVSVVIHDAQDLNLFRIQDDNAKANPKGKERTISSVKGKVNTVNQVASDKSVISKAALAQRARRQRERNEKVSAACQMVQRRRRERERSGECIIPRQPRFFPSLIPSRCHRACLERASMKETDENAIQPMSVSLEISENDAPQRTMVTNAVGSSSMTAILSQTPNLVGYPISGRSSLLRNNILSHPKPPDQVDLHSMVPRNLGLEVGRRRIQVDLLFKAVGATSSGTPCNLSSSNNGENQHPINTRERFELGLGRGRIRNNVGKFADFPQLKHCPLQPEISPQQTQMRANSIRFLPVAKTNYMAPVMTFSYGGPSLPDSLGKPGIALHAAQSDCLKVTPDVPHSIDSKVTDDKQGTERSVCLPKFSKQRNESNQKDYIQTELSRHAAALEKRAVQLLIEEGKEMQRVKALNILGNLA